MIGKGMNKGLTSIIQKPLIQLYNNKTVESLFTLTLKVSFFDKDWSLLCVEKINYLDTVVWDFYLSAYQCIRDISGIADK